MTKLLLQKRWERTAIDSPWAWLWFGMNITVCHGSLWVSSLVTWTVGRGFESRCRQYFFVFFVPEIKRSCSARENEREIVMENAVEKSWKTKQRNLRAGMNAFEDMLSCQIANFRFRASSRFEHEMIYQFLINRLANFLFGPFKSMNTCWFNLVTEFFK